MADEALKVRTVILPVDKDDKSKLAVDWYCKKLHKESDNVIIVHAFIAPEMYDIHIPWPAVKSLCEDWNYLNSLANKEADQLLEECQQICNSNSVSAKTEQLYITYEKSDKIQEDVCEFLQKHKADLIVMNYSSKGDQNGELGSMCSYLVAHSGVPVEILYL